MRNFRDAKAMAATLRAVLAAKGLKITVSESLELIAKAFGVADWNTLSAAARAEARGPRNDASLSPPPITKKVLKPDEISFDILSLRDSCRILRV